MSKDVELKFISNCIDGIDETIKRLSLNIDADRSVKLPGEFHNISLEAHDSACVYKRPQWLTEAPRMAQLDLLLDWRRAMLVQHQKASERNDNPKPRSPEHIELRRAADRVRKQRSRDRRRAAALAAGLVRPRGRPKKNVG